MNFAYLNLKEHPRGNIILERLIQEGFVPKIIIEENSPLSTKGRNSLLTDINKGSKAYLFPSVQEILADYKIPLLEVENHNDPDCKEALKKYDLDLIVLGDTRIIKKSIIDIPKRGILNAHPGYLPDVRGNNPYIWALIHDLPQGCSIHFIDENVDTGPLLLREKIDIENCTSYPQLLETINELCARLMTEAVSQISKGTERPLEQSQLAYTKKSPVEEFFLAPPHIKSAAIEKLEKST